MREAKPIWVKGLTQRLNINAVFKTEIDLVDGLHLHIAGSAFYRVYINDCFLGFGPARTAKGYLREDVFDLSEYKSNFKDKKATIIIDAVGYYCCSLSTVKEDSFLMAEIQKDGQVLSYTGRDFEAFLPNNKVEKVERYSVQRHFTEIYDYRNKTDFLNCENKSEIEILNKKPIILDRKAPYPDYNDIDLDKSLIQGKFEFNEEKPYKIRRYSWGDVPPGWGSFNWDEIPYHPFSWVQRHNQIKETELSNLPIVINKGNYAIFDFGCIECGFIKLSLESIEESDVVVAFSELYLGDEFEFSNINVHNVLEYFTPCKDVRNTQSFEPYTFRYLLVAVKDGAIKLDSVGVKTFAYDVNNVKWQKCDNEIQTSICRAAVRTFSHNAVDLYTDCPSRERAGWLCDSYFTARTEYMLTGKTSVEDAFLENYRLFKNDGSYPEGVVPDCYPSDVRKNAEFIPQWTMWYILEIEEYLLKRGHEDLKNEFKDNIFSLLKFYREYENEDGLLESLPSWNFVEWSKANEWTKGVNYPTNFLYSRVLEAVYNIYGDEFCLARCHEVREMSEKQSFNGHYFLDHSQRDDNGLLKLQNDSSEACQYYAILFGNIDIHSDKYKELKNLITNVFSPNRNGKMPEIMEVNAFIGAYLRMDALIKMGEYQLLLKDVEGFFGKMEEYTGTLWETRQFVGSYDHGFASYAFVVIQEALNALKKDNI